jgi:RHS repeat-associated protein
MATTYYYSMGGEIFGESIGGQMTTYMTDALGSVIGTSQSGALVNQYSYTPYGRVLQRSGSGADPSFMWNGSAGYRSTTRGNSDYYVRARHFSSRAAAWTSLDPLWPRTEAYSYASLNPVRFVDPTGHLRWNSECCSKALDITIEKIVINQGPGVGVVSFDVWIDYVIQPRGTRDGLGSSRANWFEKQNMGSYLKPPVPSDQWYNVNDYPATFPPGFPNFASDQVETDRRCPPGADGRSLDSDEPSYQRTKSSQPRVYCLCFRFVVTSSCDAPVLIKTASVTISFEQQVPVINFPADALTDQYCSGLRNECPQELRG